jgi:hypothetical protein
LTRLLQEGEETVTSLRTRLLAAFDPERQFEDELRRRVERLEKSGEMAPEEGSRFLGQVLLVSSPSQKPANLREVEGLLRQVAALEEELVRLKASADQEESSS